MADSEAVIALDGVVKRFGRGPAVLDGMDARIPAGRITGLVGPDGAGKTTLLRIMAGLLLPTEGTVRIMGMNPADRASAVKSVLSYMPQQFGLYEDLTVMENLMLHARLRGVSGAERRRMLDHLLAFTRLGPFTRRLAGRLSGGMKQKLGLACALIQQPRILLLDEPSVGVDPVSRRELWQMVRELARQDVTIVWSTAYIDEAERCDSVLVLDSGRLLFSGRPSELTDAMEGHSFMVDAPVEQRRTWAIRLLSREDVVDSVIQGSSIRVVFSRPPSSLPDLGGELAVRAVEPRFEDGVIHLMGGLSSGRLTMALRTINHGPGESGDAPGPASSAGQAARSKDDGPDDASERPPAVIARTLTKKFGDFTAVDGVSFEVRPGEVFGLLGPNGAGKSTTFRMMCGLLQPSSGHAEVAGVDLVSAPAQARQRIGYMAQKFSLYGDLSVRQNLEFFGGVYGLGGRALRRMVDHVLEEFQLAPFAGTNASAIPLGFKQRLSMACATMHDPEILFLDEPTSGVDPITRREFWVRINSMVQGGMAVVVTTHFMDEAEYCDRVALMYRGRIIAMDSPDGIKKAAATPERPNPTLEEAFIHVIEESSDA